MYCFIRQSNDKLIIDKINKKLIITLNNTGNEIKNMLNASYEVINYYDTVDIYGGCALVSFI